MSEVKTKPTTKQLARHKLPTGVLAITADVQDNHAIAGCVDGVYRVDLESGECSKLYEHDSYVSSVVVQPKTDTLISAGFDGCIKWYRLAEAKVIRDVPAHRFWSWEMACSPNGRWLASVTGQYLAGSEKYDPRSQSEPCVKILDAETGNQLHSLAHVPSVQCVAISPDSRFVAAGNLMGEVRVWDIESGDLVNQWTTPDFTSWGIIKSHCYIGGIFALRFSPDGEHMLAAGMGPMRDPMAGNGRQLWQRFAWKEQPARKIDETRKDQSGEGLMETLAVHPNGEYFLMGGRLRGGNWNAALFDMASGENLHSMNTKCRMTHAYFSEDGSRLVSAGCNRQPNRNDEGSFEPWGVVEIREIQSS